MIAHRLTLIAAPIALLSFALSANAQELDCTNPTSQVEMTGCAARSHEAADTALNTAYRAAMARARQQDEYLTEGQVPSATMLRDAQRAWITFRDGACDTESTMARGGTLQNQLFFICLERLTKHRTEDLKIFADGLEG